MSILSPVNKKIAVVYSPLMPISLRNTLLERNFTLVEVPDEEWDSMGCNVLAIAPGKCLLVEGNQLRKKDWKKRVARLFPSLEKRYVCRVVADQLVLRDLYGVYKLYKALNFLSKIRFKKNGASSVYISKIF